MPKQAVVQGVYSDLKTIKSRSVVQVVVEVPIERGQEIVEAFGFPQPAQEVHVVIARMANGHQEREEPEGVDGASTGRRRFEELPAPQQAALACKEKAFQRFLHEEYSALEVSEEEAAREVREICNVASRADLKHPGPAASWRGLYDRYQVWLRVPA